VSRHLISLLIGLTVAGTLPAFASGVAVSSQTLDVYRTCVLTGVSAASTAVADTLVNQQAPTTNSGAATTMNVQSRTSQNRRVYISFDLTLCSPVIPAAASVASAELDLFITALPAVCRTVDTFRLTSTWAEGTITWNNQPVGTTTNDPPTGQRSSFTTIGAAPCTYSTNTSYASWTVTGDVAAWVAGSATNYGWMLRDDAEDSATTRTITFATSEANNAARGPRLEITYRP
jgi:hypothetical protein